MAREKEVKEQWYISKYPGYCMTLPNGMKYVEKIGTVTRTKSIVTFPSKGGKMVKSTDPRIQDFIETSVAFKRGLVMRVQTPEEIEADKIKAGQEIALANMKSLVGTTGFHINFKEMKDEELLKIAESVGAETMFGTKTLAADKIVENLEILVFGEVQKSKKQREVRNEEKSV